MGIPNWLSLFRVFLVPVFPLVLFSNLPGARYLAAGVYVLAFITDIVDGWLARKLSMVTKLGRILDPLADKLMSAMALVCVVWLYTGKQFTLMETGARETGVPPHWFWWAVVIFFAKEMLMGIGSVIMYRKVSDVNPSAFPGKLSMALFFFTCAAMLLFPSIPAVCAFAMIAVATASTIFALFHYIRAYLHRTGT
jgi:cardiolipin synthase